MKTQEEKLNQDDSMDSAEGPSFGMKGAVLHSHNVVPAYEARLTQGASLATSDPRPKCS